VEEVGDALQAAAEPCEVMGVHVIPVEGWAEGVEAGQVDPVGLQARPGPEAEVLGRGPAIGRFQLYEER
jgi:hypothetical protein